MGERGTRGVVGKDDAGAFVIGVLEIGGVAAEGVAGGRFGKLGKLVGKLGTDGKFPSGSHVQGGRLKLARCRGPSTSASKRRWPPVGMTERAARGGSRPYIGEV